MENVLKVLSKETSCQLPWGCMGGKRHSDYRIQALIGSNPPPPSHNPILDVPQSDFVSGTPGKHQRVVEEPGLKLRGTWRCAMHTCIFHWQAHLGAKQACDAGPLLGDRSG